MSSTWAVTCYGVQSASQKYFGKDVSELSLAELRFSGGHHQQSILVQSKRLSGGDPVSVL